VKISSNLPAFPAEMYYPRVYSGGEMDLMPQYGFMRQPSLNGTTFYVGPAAVLNISATNDTTTVQRFGYMVMEQGTGFPLESAGNANVTDVQVIVPINRWYTIMAMRSNSVFGNAAACASGTFMNDTACRTPPKSNSTINPTTEGQIINIKINLAISRKYMSGCIGVAGNSTAINNISLILPKMAPWTGFVPPARADVQDINLSNQAQMNVSDPRCPGKVAWYNISVLNSDYFVEFYGRNGTIAQGGEFVGALQNASFSSSDQTINITLRPLAGYFSAASANELSQGTNTNTTKFTIRVQNSTGGAITQDRPHIEVTLKNASIFGEVTYIAEATNGAFSLMIPRGITGKVKVFSNNAPPKEKVLNLSANELNITLINMQGGDGGFKRKNASGQLETMNISQDSFNVNLGFFRAGGTCDVLVPASSCNLTSMGARDFNPFVALVAGKVNMQLRMSSGVSIMFYNFDMFAAKQPPMESVINSNATSGGSSANQVWEFGSFVPADVYDYAIVSIPYLDSVINDSAQINITVPMLYDENWNAVWNSSRGDSISNITTDVDDYVGNANNRSFNSTGYRNFFQTGGALCNTTNNSMTGGSPAVYCYVDTSSNIIYLRVPHFSGVSPNVAGSAPSTSTAENTGTTGNTGTTTTTEAWTMTYSAQDSFFATGYTKELFVKNRIKVNVSNEDHYVGLIALTNTTATINVSSTPQQAVFNIGDEKKFEVTNDNYYDLLVKLNGITLNKANITVKRINELIPSAGLAVGNNTGAEGGVGANEEGSSGSSKAWKWILWIAIIIIAGVAVVFGIRYYNHKRRFY
jgi:hypothetical protein